MNKKRKPSPRMTTNRRLPHDLILEILSRVPAKSVVRFKCLSKPFHNSLSDPNFTKMHVSRATEQGTINLLLASEPRPGMDRARLFCMETHLYSLEGDTSFAESVQIENPLDLHLDHGSKLLGPCNGIVCLCGDNLVTLLNPFTREYKIVKFDNEFRLRRIAYGLGYDEARDDYVLVQIVDTTTDLAKYDYFDEFDDDEDSDDGVRYGSEVSVYSLNKASCSKVSFVPYKIRYGHGLGIYLNGYLHWVASKKGSSRSVITAVHNGDNKFRDFSLPGNLREDANFTMGVLGGNVSILCDMFAAETELWEMEKYGVADSWVKLFSMAKKILPRGPQSRALSFCEKGKVLLMDGNAQVLYYPKLKKLWNIKYRNIRWPFIDRSVIYVASLVPLNTGTYVEDVDGVQPAKKRKHRADWIDWEDSEEDGNFDDDWDDEFGGDMEDNIS